MKLTLLSWNVGGASLLKTPRIDRAKKRQQYNDDLKAIIDQHRPDILLLQEIVQYEIEISDNKRKIEDLFDRPPGYNCAVSIAVDTKRNSHPVKWKPCLDDGGWGGNIYLAQGYGIMWRDQLAHCSIWEDNQKLAHADEPLEKEDVRLEDGLFSGDRDTEPRVLVVSRFIENERDIFVVNLHLTTLKGEREGFPDRDSAGSEMRQRQVSNILDGIVSRLNRYRSKQNESRKASNKPESQPAIWFLAGDFNAVPDSPEIKEIEHLHFARLCDDSPTKCKKSPKGGSSAPTIKVDYIFAGPTHHAFDPHVVASKRCTIMTDIKSSDHFPIIAQFDSDAIIAQE